MDILFEDLVKAYLDCRRNKRNTASAQRFEVDLEHNLIGLYDDLRMDRYEISPSEAFVVKKPVRREVFAANFRDRIVHHYLAARINPLFEKEFINDSYSCRVGKGTLFGARRLHRFVAQCSNNYTQDCYILQCDLKGFFMSIDRPLLASMLDNFIGENYTGIDIDAIRQLSDEHVNAFIQSMNSYLGLMQHLSGYNFCKTIKERIHPEFNRLCLITPQKIVSQKKILLRMHARVIKECCCRINQMRRSGLGAGGTMNFEDLYYMVYAELYGLHINV